MSTVTASELMVPPSVTVMSLDAPALSDKGVVLTNGAGVASVPIAEFAIGPLQTIANFFVGIPFDDDENTGIAYAVQVRYLVWEQVGIGFESFGEVENVFESDTEDGHFIGPAIFTEFDLGRNRILEPRAAVLFGLSDNTPDAVLSVNLELKF